MTFKIARSQMFVDFDVAAAAHASAMKEWRAHMTRVEADRQNPDLTAIERHVAHPRPGAHPLIEDAVNERGEVDFEIIEDGPTAEQILAARKNELMARVSAAEQIAIAAIVPPGKARLYSMRETDILTDKENAGLLRSAAAAIGLTKTISDEDAKHLDGQARRRTAIETINRVAAQAHHDIEDLTIETIDTWKLPNFAK